MRFTLPQVIILIVIFFVLFKLKPKFFRSLLQKLQKFLN